MQATSVLESCRLRAAEELEAELMEEALFEGEEAEEEKRPSSGGWRAGFTELLSGIIPGVNSGKRSSEDEAPAGGKRAAKRISYPNKLKTLYRQFDGAKASLWKLMTAVNTEVMTLQSSGAAQGSAKSELSDTLIVLGGKAQGTAEVFEKTSLALLAMSEGDREVLRVLSELQESLEAVFTAQVDRVQEATISLEKARRRAEMAQSSTQS